MAEFGHRREDWLKKRPSLPNGISSYHTFSCVFQAIEPTVFDTCFATRLGKLGFAMRRRKITIDGKALRASLSSENTHLHAVTA
jgi:DDE_Tnp_1-associated